MAGTVSATTFIVGDRLPWPDDALPSRATGPLEAGAVYADSSRHECLIRKISMLGATLRAELANAPGDAVAVELSTGQRPSARIAWVTGPEAGVSFDQPVDLLALINRSLISQPAERRTMPRVDISCPAYIRWSGRVEPVAIRNVSAKGLQIQGEELPDRGTLASIFVDGLVIPAGEVMWRRDDLAGIQLFEQMSWTSLQPWIREMMRKGVQ